MNPSTLNFRPPSSSSSSSPFMPPTPTWISGPWHVHHSSLPMWKSKRNVTITYTLNPSSSSAPPGSFSNLVQSQPLDPSKDKVSTVKGIEKPDPDISGAWNWRGKGLLKVAGSHWEVLGWGEEDGGWMVIYFEKTLFTPAGVDVLGRRKEGVGRELLELVKGRIGEADDADFRKCASDMFEVKQDGGEEGDDD